MQTLQKRLKIREPYHLAAGQGGADWFDRLD